MRKTKEQTVCTRNMVLAAVVLGILLATVGSVALAVPVQGEKGLSPRAFLDPFELRTIVVPSESSASGSGSPVVVLRRPEIRMPLRPPVRSAFRPVY
jgi:hypothetical protein